MRRWLGPALAVYFVSVGLARAQSPASPPELLGPPRSVPTATPTVPAKAPAELLGHPQPDPGLIPPAASAALGLSEPASPLPAPCLGPADGASPGAIPDPVLLLESDTAEPSTEGGFLESVSRKWFEKLSIRGYTQVRFGRTIQQDPNGADPSMFGDRSINGRTENFFIRRARIRMAGDVSDHVFVNFQTDFANTPTGSSSTLYGQIRDVYADIYVDLDKVNRFRIGQSKIPWGFEEMQSSGLRVPIDRSDAIDSGSNPIQRDLGLFYYWTPVDKQRLLRWLVDSGLKGTGNYGIVALGFYNGQGGSRPERNLNLHTLARVTWPFQLPGGQAVEMSIQGYTGQIVVSGDEIRPLGQGEAQVPLGTGGSTGLLEQRLAGTFVWYPQPFGLQMEYNIGRGPGLNDAQTAVMVRPLHGGYVMGMFKMDTTDLGTFIPYARYQHYLGGYRSVANAPYGTHNEFDLGCEWQIWKSLEVVVEYALVDGVNLSAINEPDVASYRNFRGQVLRCQVQFNY